jgi:hypothetical protein
MRVFARWLATFAGFPIGGLAAMLIVGPVDDPTGAAVGGMISGLALGTVQAWGFGAARPSAHKWISATAIGFAVGLPAGAALVDYRTTLSALMMQGAISGLAVGTAQSVVLWQRLGRLAIVWPAALAGAWALGWSVTYAGGIEVDKHFSVFGSFGALTVTVVTSVLPVVLARRNGVDNLASSS